MQTGCPPPNVGMRWADDQIQKTQSGPVESPPPGGNSEVLENQNEGLDEDMGMKGMASEDSNKDMAD